MKKKTVLLDIVFYVAVPMLIWNYGREYIGDYIAMLCSTVPGFLYSIARFLKERQFNLTGLFAVASLFISTFIDLISGATEQMLWNQVYVGLGFSVVFLVSILIKRPLALYFSADFAALSGHPYENSLALFFDRKNFFLFQWLTLIFLLRSVILSLLKAWLITSYGVDSYSKMLIFMQIAEWFFTGFITIGYILVNIKINKFLNTHHFDFPVQ